MLNKVSTFLNKFQKEATIHNYRMNSSFEAKCRLSSYNNRDLTSYTFFDKKIFFSYSDLDSIENNCLVILNDSSYILAGVESRFYADGSDNSKGFLTYVSFFVDVYKKVETRDGFGNPVITKDLWYSNMPISLRSGVNFVSGHNLDLSFETMDFFTCEIFELDSCFFTLNGQEYQIYNSFSVFSGLQKFTVKRSSV